MSANAGEIRARMVLNNDEFKRKMNETREDMKRTGFSAEQMSADFGKIQKASAIVGGSIAAVIGGSVKIAADFEQSMAKVQAISGSTAEEFARQEAAAREMGAATIFSASEAAEGLSYLAMAGFDVNEQIGSLPAVLNAAIAGNISLGESANIVTNIMSAFKLEAEDSGMAVDVLAKAANSANTDIPLMGEAFKMVAPVASALGWSIEETAAAIGELGNVGISGSQAGTVLRASLLALANPTGQTKDVMKELNIEVVNAEGNMKSLPELMGHISSKMDDMTDAQKTQTAAQLVGTQAASGFIALLDVGEDGLRDFTTELENSQGAAQKMADVQADTLTGSFKEFQSAMEEAGIKLGNEFLPIFRDIVDWGTKIVSSFDDINISQAKSVIAFGGTAAAIGLTISTIGKLVGAVRGLMASMGPAGWLIAGVSLLGGFIAAKNVSAEEAVEVNLDHARSLDEESTALSTQIERYEELKEKNKLTTRELSKFVDLQSRLAMETDPEKIEQMQKEFDELFENSGLTNAEMGEFLQLNDDIIEKVPTSNIILTEQGTVLLENTDAARAYNDQLLKELELELRKQAVIASSELEKNIKEHTEALEKQNELAADYISKQEDIGNAQSQLAAEELKLQIARENGDKASIEYAERQVEEAEKVVSIREREGYALQGQIIEQEEIINNIELQILKGQEAYQDLIEYRLEQADVVAEKGKEVEAIDKAIEKTLKLHAEAKKKHTQDGKLTEEGQKLVDKYNDQLSVLRKTKPEIEKLKWEQDKLSGSIDDSIGMASDLNYELEKDISKHLIQTGFDYEEAKRLNEELGKSQTKYMTVKYSHINPSGPAVAAMYHTGGIAGEGLPKLHDGDRVENLMSRLNRAPLHNEIDVRLLRNEMVLTEGQQANLWRMVEGNVGGASSGNDYTREMLNAMLKQNQLLMQLLEKENIAIVEFESLYRRTKDRLSEDNYSFNKQRRRL